LTPSDLVPLPSPTVVVSVSGRCASSYVALFFFLFLRVLYSLSLSLSLSLALCVSFTRLFFSGLLAVVLLAVFVVLLDFPLPPSGSRKCVL
jgi:uncharacterized membrane protein YesL